MKREIIVIDEDLCNGCGECVPSCHEGALHIIDEKARLIIDLLMVYYKWHKWLRKVQKEKYL